MLSNNYMNSPRSVEDAVGVLLASWTDQAPVAAIQPDLSRSTAADDCGEWDKAC